MQRIGIRRPAVLVRILSVGLVSLGLLGLGNGVVQKNRKGNEWFARGNYDEALKLYRDAQVERPNLPALHFNVGNALYKQAKPDQALSEYQSALSGDEASVNAKAYYNIGNAFFKQGKLAEAIEAYKKSLQINPQDVDAKFNLEFAQLRLQQQQQEKQQQNEQSEQKNQEQNEEQEGDQQENQDTQDQQGEEEQQAQPQQGQEEPSQAEQQKAEKAPEGQMSEEEAQRILDALNDKEKEVQERRRARVARRVIRELDW